MINSGNVRGAGFWINPNMCGFMLISTLFLTMNFKAKRKPIENPKLTITLPNRMTVSGIVDASFSQGNKWLCEMGTGEPVKGIKIITTDNFHKSFKIDLTNYKPSFYRLGDNRSDIIPGDYGFNYNFEIKNKTNSRKRKYII